MELESLALALAVAAGSLLTVRAAAGRGAFTRALSTARAEMRWLFLLLLAFGTNYAVSRLGIVSPLRIEQLTPWTVDLLRGLQGGLPAELAVPLFSLVYLALFPALFIAVPLTLLAKGEGHDLRTYCLALSLAYAGLVAFHLLFQSPRPGLTPGSGVAPLMYGDPFWGSLSSDLGSRGNSFPSGHTAIITAMLVALYAHRKGAAVLLVALALTILGVLYLGLHWPLDVVAGVFLGAAAGVSARLYMRKVTPGP